MRIFTFRRACIAAGGLMVATAAGAGPHDTPGRVHVAAAGTIVALPVTLPQVPPTTVPVTSTTALPVTTTSRPPVRRASRSSITPRPTTTTVTVLAAGYGTEPADGRRYLGEFRVTCYGPPQFPQGQHTASGEPVGPGSIAASPRAVPRGTRLELEGIGRGHVNDTGGAVNGHHLDLWRPSCRGWANPTVKVWQLP